MEELNASLLPLPKSKEHDWFVALCFQMAANYHFRLATKSTIAVGPC